MEAEATTVTADAGTTEQLEVRCVGHACDFTLVVLRAGAGGALGVDLRTVAVGRGDCDGSPPESLELEVVHE